MDSINPLAALVGPNYLKRNLPQVLAATKQLRNKIGQEKGGKETSESFVEKHSKNRNYSLIS